jgi:hypothetical protein
VDPGGMEKKKPEKREHNINLQNFMPSMLVLDVLLITKKYIYQLNILKGQSQYLLISKKKYLSFNLKYALKAH